jgi:hypothetical protein
MAVAIAWWASFYCVPISFKWPAWSGPVEQFLIGLNAPAVQIRMYLTKLVWIWSDSNYPNVYIVETIGFFPLVGLLWYAVSFEAGGNGESILTPRTRVRHLADALAAIFGVVLVITAFRIHRRDYGYLMSLRGLVSYPDVTAVLFLIWGAVITAFYGHDLWACFRPAKRE